MCDFERHGGERARQVIAAEFESANPKIALMLALHVGAPFGDRVAFHRLVAKRSSGRDPIPERAGFEIEVERASVRPEWFDSDRAGRARDVCRDSQAKEGEESEAERRWWLHRQFQTAPAGDVF